jgi:DNA-binding NarL/FixJ family response regulator
MMVMGILEAGGITPVMVADLPEMRTADIRVSVLADDRSLADELIPGLRATPDLRLMPAELRGEADVVLVLTPVVTDTSLAAITEIAESAVNKVQCLVLVAGPLRERHLTRAISSGVVSIVPLRDATPRSVARAVVGSYRGASIMPETITRWLVDEARMSRQDLLASYGLAPGGLTLREVDVLRLLAAGEDTLSIAEQLRYSERTIKKIIQDLLARLKLRNRTHAVSYAMRVGAF